MTQRAGKKHAAALCDDDKIRLMDLVQFLKEAHEVLEEEGDEDAAFRFEMLVDYFTNTYRPSQPLTFKSIILGL